MEAHRFEERDGADSRREPILREKFLSRFNSSIRKRDDDDDDDDEMTMLRENQSPLSLRLSFDVLTDHFRQSKEEEEFDQLPRRSLIYLQELLPFSEATSN